MLLAEEINPASILAAGDSPTTIPAAGISLRSIRARAGSRTPLPLRDSPAEGTTAGVMLAERIRGAGRRATIHGCLRAKSRGIRTGRRLFAGRIIPKRIS